MPNTSETNPSLPKFFDYDIHFDWVNPVQLPEFRLTLISRTKRRRQRWPH